METYGCRKKEEGREHLNESSPPLEIGARSQESGVRRKEEEGRRKEEEGRSHNKCFYKYEMLPEGIRRGKRKEGRTNKSKG
ncbi:hypothetical protein [Microcoleus sp. D2_18a_B4]|uniref:hypothetical protein n=1 Tax=Microcoleus sp. D2_18a_B4 TaxID=3055329 RepID=UPI002FD00BA9